jgi:hypothetical protein
MNTHDALLIALLRQLAAIEPKFEGGTGQVYAPFEGVPRNAETVAHPDYDAEQIFHHLRILFRLGFIESDVPDPIIKPHIHFTRVTDTGHRLLASCDAPPPSQVGFVHF